MTPFPEANEPAHRQRINALTQENGSLRVELERLRRENATLCQRVTAGQAEQREAFLLALSDRLHALDDPVEILRVAAEAIAARTAIEAAGFNEVRPDAETAERIAANLPRNASDGANHDGRFPLDRYGPGWGAELRAGRNLFVGNQPADPEPLVLPHFSPRPTRAFAAVPLFESGRLRAWMYAANSAPHEWTEDERQLLRDVAIRSWSARERARTLQALLKKHDRLRRLADELPQIIWTSSGAGAANYFNRRWFEYSGLSDKESYAVGWQAIVHPEDNRASHAKWRKALEAGVAFDAEYRLRNACGDYRWFIGRNVPLRDETGAIATWFGSATDIHELKTAQAKALQQEEYFRRAIEDAPIPVIMFAESGKILALSRIWCRVTGYSREEMPRFEQWLDSVFLPGEVAAREQIQGVFSSGGATEQIELEILTRGLERRHWIFSISTPGVLLNGKRFAVGMALDVTDRQQTQQALAASQELLHLIVESAHEHAIVAMDPERRITSWNTGAREMTGYVHEETMGMTADIVFTAEDRLRGVPEQEAETARTQGRAADERWHLRKDGTRFWGSGVMLPMRVQPGGEIVGLVKIFRDETEKREAREALEVSRRELEAALASAEKARAEAEAATQAKDRFIAVLSHELRTPLTPVLLAVHALGRRKDLPEAVHETLAMIRNNIQLEAHLVDDLLDVSRIAHGKMELAIEPVAMHEVIQRAIAVIEPTILEKRQRLLVQLVAGADQLMGDAVRLQQVVWNLLTNAAKFTPTGGEIQLTTASSAGQFKVTISDTGIGIEPESLKRIFDAFGQAHGGITREYGGLGLGLSISDAAVNAHGGELRAESAGPGLGARFTVVLPLETKSTEDAQRAS